MEDPPGTSSAPTDPRARLFQLLWLAFLAVHLAMTSPRWTVVGAGFLQSGSGWIRLCSLLAGASIFVAFLRPQRRGIFAVTLILWTLPKLDALPAVPNHILLAILVNGTILAALAAHRPQKPPESWTRPLFPLLRIELLLVYFFAILAKCNFDYFDPSVSCGAVLFTQIAEILSFPPPGELARRIAIYGSFAVELLIPLLLLCRSTRLLGFGLGTIFHLALALHPNPYLFSFSAEVLALLALFLPPEVAEGVDQDLESLSRRGPLRGLGALAAGLPLLLSLLLLIPGHPLSVAGIEAAAGRVLSRQISGWIRNFWLVSMALLFGRFVLRARSVRPGRAGSGRFLWPGRSLLALFPALVLLNGMSPYLGLKTQTTFSMFSNLRVEGVWNNHWFIPAGWQLTGYSDVVELLSTTPAGPVKILQSSPRLSAFEFRQRLSLFRSGRFHLTYRREGREKTLRFPGDGGHEDVADLPWIAWKLLSFKRPPPPGPCPCEW